MERIRASSAPVVALSGPAGYGKSTVLRQWDAADPRPFAWVRIPVHGVAPQHLAQQVMAAVDEAAPAAAATVLPRASREALWFSTVLPVLAAGLAAPRPSYVLVLDDVQWLEEGRTATGLLETLISALPQGSRLAVSSRLPPQRVLRKLRPEARVLELGATDLAMDAVEAEALVESTGAHLGADDFLTLLDRTEGWPVGLYLMARSLASGGHPTEVDTSVRSAPWLEDFLRDELVGELSDDDRGFLLRSSVLDVLEPAACGAVTDEPRAAAVLDRLAETNQLLVPLNRGRSSYRIHHLLEDHLRQTLRRESPVAWADSNARACRWYEMRDDSDAAVRHAIEAGDDEWLGDLVWRHAATLLINGENTRVRGWLASISNERLERVARLAMLDGFVAQQEGDTSRMQRRVMTAESLLRRAPRTPENEIRRSSLDLLLAVEGRGGVAGLVRHTTAFLDAADPADSARTVGHYLRGVGLLLAGRRAPALTDLRRATSLARTHGQPLQEAHVGSVLVQLAVAAGDLDQASAMAANVASIVERPEAVAVATNAPILASLATASLAAGDREAARTWADRALSMTALLGDTIGWHGVGGRLAIAQVYLQLGELDHAKPLIADARRAYLPQWRTPVLDQRFEQTLQLMRDVSVVPATSHPLTLAELRVLHYLPSHLSYPEIADELVLSRHTVKSQAMSVFRKLDVNGRSEAVARARSLGLLPPTG